MMFGRLSIVVALAALAAGSALAQPVPLPPVEPGSVQQVSELRLLSPPPISVQQAVATQRTPLTGPETIGPGNPVVPGPLPLDSGPSDPQAARALSIEELEGIALVNNPALARASAAVRTARGKWLQVGLPPNPNIGYSAAEVGNDGKAGQQGGYIEQEFVRGHKLRLNRQVAEQEIRQAEQHYAVEQFRVINDVRVGCFEVLILQRKLELARRLLAIGTQGYSASDQLFKAQEASRVDVLQARIEVNQARILEQNTVNAYASAWRRLAAVLGTPGMGPIPLVGNLEADLPPISWENSLGRLLAASPELAEARAAVSRAQRAIDRAKAEPIPNVNLQTIVQHDNASNYDIAGIQATFPLPLINRNQGGIMQAQGEASQATQQLRQLELSLQQRLAATYERYANARQQVERFAKEILPDAKTALDLVTQGYKQGEFSYLILLTAQRTYFQTNLSYLDALRDLRESTVELEGMLLRDSLQSQITVPNEQPPTPPSANTYVPPPLF
ncbi:MAG: TolC family protein [Pirellulales bacterium]|nr:TolC family protein [Pirellulales bacterium]